MFSPVCMADFQRMLGDILDRARSQTGRLALEVESTFTKNGALGNARLPLAIEDQIAPSHDKTVTDVMELIVRFTEKSDIQLDDLIAQARSQLVMYNEYCIERISRLTNVANSGQAIPAIRERFHKRVAHAEHDLKVGFINGKAAVVTESPTSQSRALRLLKAIYDSTRSTDQPVFVTELSETTGLSEQEAYAAWRYLGDRGLIQTFSVPNTAQINGAGIDAIENAKSNPDRATENFPSATYNIVNNTVHVGTAVNSPMQQAGSGSSQHQTVTYNLHQIDELRRTLTEITSHFDELKLNPVQARIARAQIATLESQLDVEPNPVILRQAGHTLRNITEGAIASLIVTAVQPVPWARIADVLGRLFS
jgi:hypothetical protein